MNKKSNNKPKEITMKDIAFYCRSTTQDCLHCEYVSLCDDMSRYGMPKPYQYLKDSGIFDKTITELEDMIIARKKEAIKDY